MPTAPIRLVFLAALVGIATTILTGVGTASAGTFTINACLADRTGFSTQAFSDYATRGMVWRRGCRPEGTGLITGNVVRSGRVKPGAQSRVVMDAPPGTNFVNLNWSGRARRLDCRYALQMYALGPDGRLVKAIRNFRANHNCRKDDRPQVALIGIPRPKQFDIAGATRIVQRAVCNGNQRKPFCSARAANSVATYFAEATVVDQSPPGVTIAQDNALTQGAWVGGIQAVSYSASDNVGIKSAQAVINGSGREIQGRACNYAQPIPCTNDPGSIQMRTQDIGEGTQSLRVQAVDAANNAASSDAITVRIDNTAPSAVPATVDGGDGWRSSNDFDISWQNPDEGDRAPITSAHWRLCRPDGTECTSGTQEGTAIARLVDLRVPAPGEWELTVVREDAAGNRNDSYASPAVRLRHDPEPPALAFEAAPADDPTLVSIAARDGVSAVAGGQIEISGEGSGIWQALPTRLDGGHLLARIDDAALPPGRYVLRGQATDLAGNVGVIGSAQALNLPLRVGSTMEAGVVKTKIVRVRARSHKGRRGKKRDGGRRRVTMLKPSASVGYGGHVTVAGRLTNLDGQPLPGQQVQVVGPGANGDQVLATLTTDQAGSFSYRASGSASRTLRFVYAGTTTMLPTEQRVTLEVHAAGTFRPSRRRLVNGGRLTLRGRVDSTPIPAGGKLVEVQVRQPTGEWTTFRTLRTDGGGHWSMGYRFRLVRCHTTYRLRAHIPAEAGYPFTAGHTPARRVTVRGAEGPCP